MLYGLLLFWISVLPVILIGLYIYNKDRNKESKKMLAKLFIGGVASALLVLISSVVLEKIFPVFFGDNSGMNSLVLIIHVFVFVAFVEEFCKWIFAYGISYNNKDFDEFYDAIIYCIFVALGFACFENILYVFQNGFFNGIVRAILAVPGHACDGMFMGYYLGLSKISELNNNNTYKKKNLILSLIVPTITHGIYDYCLFNGSGLFIIIFFAFVIWMYIYTYKKIKVVSSIKRKIRYKNNYCPNCGHIVKSDFCPMCGRKNF